MVDESKEWTSARIPLVIAAAGVIALGVGYFVYVRGQMAYYSGRNLRILARASEQINGAIADAQDKVRSFATPYGSISSPPKDCGSPLAVRYDLDRLSRRWKRSSLARRHGGLWRYREALKSAVIRHLPASRLRKSCA